MSRRTDLAVVAKLVAKPVATLVVTLVAALATPPAGAHERSASYATWSMDAEGAHVTVRLSALEASRLPWPPGDVERGAAHLADRVRLTAGGVPCPPAAAPRSLAAAPGQLVFEWRVVCPQPGARAVESDLLLDVAPSHLHFVRVRWPDGPPLERVLSDGDRRLALDAPAAPSLLASIRLGVEHILSGWDHLAFIAALLLLGGTLADTARVVTGFTLAHSVTLALAVTGWVRPEQAPVEALIGLSIALVAAENCWLAGRRSPALPWTLATVLLALAAVAAAGAGTVPPLALAGLALFTACHLARLGRAAVPGRLRWHAAFAFGLLHGFGFASVLVDAAVPPADLARLLLGFNLGVEVGQLAVVAAVLPLVRLAAAWRPAALEWGSAAVAGLGVFWFVVRAYG